VDYLPIFVDLKGRPVLVVGGGEVAARKVGLLLRVGAVVEVVAPDLCETLETQQAEGLIKHHATNYTPESLQNCALVIAATDDAAVNRQVSADAKAHNIPVNVVDAPDLCTFILPSIVDRSPVVVAVSTGGASPTLGRLLRTRLETLIPASYGRLAELAARFRTPVKKRFKSTAERRRFWEAVIQGPVAELVHAGKEQQAEQALQNALDSADDKQLSKGEVYLVGAGPGDPDLLTFRALRLMQQADVVLYDRLVSPEILDLVRREAEQIYVGKKRAFHSVRQEEINRQLIELAKAGKRVLRLKGGDPFIFGRGGEEIAGLTEAGIPFQVVPGVTAAAGCASYAGIPLTHRDYAHSVIFVTGQLKDGTVDLEWQTLVQPRQTVVVYMGLAGLEIICAKLIEHGMSAEMPAALVEQGTTPAQQVYRGTLATLPAIVAGHKVHAPTLLIIGDVVRLHDRLAWFNPQDGAKG
jgi:uroporphyrin-III C-methyltransferase/precorrin-2 dehydrogenase/sirohydrochlorin ferrochelatase